MHTQLREAHARIQLNAHTHTHTHTQGFMQPLSAGEDEPTKLKREEAERLEALKEPQVEVTKVLNYTN
jgi:hypothetical protein